MPITDTTRAESAQLPQVKIIVDRGFAPHTVVLATGRAHRLVFRREDSTACSEHLVFPGLGRSVPLPPFEDVDVELPALAPGSYAMTCQTGVLFGRILVRHDRQAPTA